MERAVDVVALHVVTAGGGVGLVAPFSPPKIARHPLDGLGVVARIFERAKGAAANRNVKLAVVRSDLEHEKAYVQQIADQNPATAEAVIHSAGMAVKKTTLRNKADLDASLGPVSGSVHLVAKSVGHRVAYEWQYSLDQKTWTSAPTTLQAKADLTGLTSGSTYYFRVRPVLKAGEAAWTQIVSLLVA